MSIQTKQAKLTTILKDLDQVLVAFSGGVDSTFLLVAAQEALGNEKVWAVIARSAIYPEREVREAEQRAEKLGVQYEVIESNECSDERFLKNNKDRCYWCKTGLFTLLLECASRYGIPTVIEGSNVDDLDDYRPGRKAIKELGIRSPLMEAGFTKAEIRECLRQRSLPVAQKPSFACLSSRIPYGTEITPQILEQVGKAEELLQDLGFRQCRVRYHGDIARIEVEPAHFDTMLDISTRQRIVSSFKALGFAYVTFDLEGYRIGSMNETF